MLMQGHSPWLMHDQSHHIEVLQGAIFMKQNMKLGLILGRLAILKKIGDDYEQHCSVRTKRLHKMKLKQYFFSLKKLEKVFF